MYSNRQKGFTLVEMLAVVAIVAIILGIGAGITWSLVKDTDVQEFVSNAKNLEEASNLYYRDSGVLPYSVEVTPTEITDKSRTIMENELNKLRVPNSNFIIDTLINNGYITTVDYDDLKDYTRITLGDTGTSGPEEFVIVNLVDNDDLDMFNGYYENDIAGFVFSKDVVLSSDENVYYSGAYKYDENNPGDNVPEAVPGNELYPYYLRIDDVVDNEDGTADITFIWEDTWVFEDGDRARGYSTDNYQFYSPEQGHDSITESNKIVRHTLVNYPVNDETVTFELIGRNLTYLRGTPDEQNVGDSSPRELVVNLEDYIEESRRDTIIPIDDDLVEEPDPGPGEYYEQYEEYQVDPNNVTAVEEGIHISGLAPGVRIVLKEVRRNGSDYSYDPNRRRVFKALNNTVLIPKNPYLQKDFQENTNSTYEYILEFYEKIPVASPLPYPNHAINIYYD